MDQFDQDHEPIGDAIEADGAAHDAPQVTGAGESSAIPLGVSSSEAEAGAPGDLASDVSSHASDGAATDGGVLPDDWQERPATPGAHEAPLGAAGEPTPSGGVPMEGGIATAVVPAVAAGSTWSHDVEPPPAVVQKRTSGPTAWVIAVVAVVAALLGSVIGGLLVAHNDNNGDGTTIRQISSGPALLNGVTNIRAVIDKVLPAVVSIDCKTPVPVTQDIFGDTTGGGYQEDQGTGMIITSNGEVVTNNHVIAGATTITVTLYGSLKALPAKLIDTDPANDVALLQIQNQSNLPTVTYGNSDHVQVGDAVVAIGNALGLSAGTPTVTQGIISAKGRTVQASSDSGNSTETLTNMFQTDAAINPGNSGGPLLDSSGQVIGMNTAVASNDTGSGQAQNIGFAIPANQITGLVPDLRSHSIPNSATSGPAFLGVSLETLTPDLKAQYSFTPNSGAVVLQVVSGSPANTAGLEEGDVITSFDGKAITSADQLATAIQGKKPGDSVTIGFYRGDSQMSVSATLGSENNFKNALSG